jgi:hypothetical protein
MPAGRWPNAGFVEEPTIVSPVAHVVLSTALGRLATGTLKSRRASNRNFQVTKGAKSTAIFLLAFVLASSPPIIASIDAAFAKDGNNGNGNSQGGGDQGGNSQGHGKGNANGHGKDKGKSAGAPGSAATSSVTKTKTGDTVTVSPNAIQLRHRNGISERITKGRYQMWDAQGRTIIDRRATSADRIRLHAKFN